MSLTSTPPSVRPPRRSLLLTCLLAATLGGTTAAEAAAPSDKEFDTSWRAQPVDPSFTVRDGELPMSLDEAIVAALSRNLGLRIERFTRAQALFGIEQQKGIYDLLLTAALNQNDNVEPSGSQLDGAAVSERNSRNFDLQLDQLVPTGGTATLDWDNERFASNSTFLEVNPQHNIDFDLQFAQPLLRGFGRENTNYQIRLAQRDASISMENLELAIMNTLQSVENAYWTLVETRQQLSVAEESLELATELHEMNRVQVDVGTKAPLELVQSEVGIATRQEEIIRSRAAVQDAADELRRLLDLDGESYWDAEILPTTDPQIDRIDIDLDEALALARRNRPDVRTQELQVEKLELDARFQRNQKLPTLDLIVNYGYNSQGGNLRVLEDPSDIFNPDPEFTIVPGGYSDSWDQLLDRDFENWTVALNLAFPIQNRSARALSTIADLALEQGRMALDQVLLGVRTDVRRAARAVETAAQQIDSASVSRRLAERNLDAEQKRYENGLSTSFQVLEIQEDLSQARSREVNAVTGYRRALAAYYLAIGRLIEENGIDLEIVDETGELRPRDMDRDAEDPDV